MNDNIKPSNMDFFIYGLSTRGTMHGRELSEKCKKVRKWLLEHPEEGQEIREGIGTFGKMTDAIAQDDYKSFMRLKEEADRSKKEKK